MSELDSPQEPLPSQWLARDEGRAIVALPETRNQLGRAKTKPANVEQSLNEALDSGVL